MANERETIRKALDARLSPLSASPRRREGIRAAVAQREKKPIPKRRSLVLAVALLLALAGAALAVGTNLFARFAQNDRRYEGVLDQVTDVTEKPASVLDEKLGMVSARVDSAYYDGQTLTLTIAVENARRISEWTPAEEEKALLKPEEGARPATPQTAMTEEEKRIMADAQAAKAAGRPFGIRKDTIWVHDHFYTEDGISLPPYYGEDEEENGTLYEIREFSPLPEDVSGRETLSVYAELGRSTEYYYFDGQKTYWRSEVQRDGVGTLNGAACTVTAQVSAIELRLTIDAETDAFPLTTRYLDGQTWQEQPWMAAVYDETGTEYLPRESSSAESARRLEIPFDGSGHIPERLRVCVYSCGVDEDMPDEEEIRSGSWVELTPSPL